MLLYFIGLLLINLLLWKCCNLMMKNNREYVLNTWGFKMNAFAAVLLIITKILENLFSTNGLTTTHDTLTPVGSLVFFMTVIQMISMLRKIILIKKTFKRKKESENNEDNNYIN